MLKLSVRVDEATFYRSKTWQLELKQSINCHYLTGISQPFLSGRENTSVIDSKNWMQAILIQSANLQAQPVEYCMDVSSWASLIDTFISLLRQPFADRWSALIITEVLTVQSPDIDECKHLAPYTPATIQLQLAEPCYPTFKLSSSLKPYIPSRLASGLFV